MRKIDSIIAESISRVVNEARMDGFRVDALRGMSFKNKIAYCKQWLGKPIGGGSSRYVFQLDDDTVLKLAKNKKGIAQNEQEYNLGHDYYISHMFPKVFNGSDGDNFLWIVSEYVLPAEEKDFEHILGVPMETVYKALTALARSERSQVYYNKLCQIYRENEDNSAFIQFLNEMEDYVVGYNIYNMDYVRLENWGICQKDGEAKLVLLDYGVNDEILKKFY